MKACRLSPRSSVWRHPVDWLVVGVAFVALLLAMNPSSSAARQPESDQGESADSGAAQPQGPPPQPVGVDAARMEEVTRFQRVTGEFRPQRRSTVAAQESGIVLELPFDEGDQVKAGEVLAVLESKLLELERGELQAKKDEEAANVKVREAELAQTMSDFTAVQDIAARGSAKPKELRDAEIARDAAQARLDVAKRAVNSVEAEMERLEQRIRDKTIVAPFDGTIIAKHTELGQWVPQGGAVVEIIETGRIDAVIDAPEAIVNLIEINDEIEIDIPALTDPVMGRVRAIVPFGSERARTYPVKIELDDRDRQIKPRMSAYVWIPTMNTMEALTIRKDAIMRNETGAFVYVARGGTAALVPVSVEFSAGTNRAVVNASLSPGESIIVEGNERLFPGAPVRVVSGGEQAPSNASGTLPSGN